MLIKTMTLLNQVRYLLDVKIQPTAQSTLPSPAIRERKTLLVEEIV